LVSALKKWCARGDDFRTFLDDFVAALPQIDFPGLNLLATPRLSKENQQGLREDLR
jgi:hypothetical protein